MGIADLTATIEIVEGAELYASLLELKELTKQQAETAKKIEELSVFIRQQVDVQMAKNTKLSAGASPTSP